MVVPILFILFFGAVEFARVAMVRHTVDNAVYEAARVAIIPGATQSEAIAEARRLLNSVGIQAPSITITPSVLAKDTPQVTVQITVPMNANSYVPPQYFAGRSITRQLTMRRKAYSKLCIAFIHRFTSGKLAETTALDVSIHT